MNLKEEISQFLYQAIQEKYERGLYRDAILAGITYLEQQICAKANFERLKMGGEPFEYFYQAFSGAEPLIRINKMTTVAEVVEQQEFPQLLIGLYRGIRHPRFHADELFDDEKTANAILIFIDYLSHQVQAHIGGSASVIQHDEPCRSTACHVHHDNVRHDMDRFKIDRFK